MSAPYPAYPPQGPPGQQTGLYRVRLTKVTSAVVVTTRQSRVYTGTLQQLESAARSALTHNLLLGWWGIPWGLIRTPMALSQNSEAMRKVRALAAQGQMPGQAPQGQQWQPPPAQGQQWQPPPAQGQQWQAPPAQGQQWQPPPAQGQQWQPPPAQGQQWQPPPAQGQPWQGQPPQR